jgi:hypothetical protein
MAHDFGRLASGLFFLVLGEAGCADRHDIMLPQAVRAAPPVETHYYDLSGGMMREVPPPPLPSTNSDVRTQFMDLSAPMTRAMMP